MKAPTMTLLRKLTEEHGARQILVMLFDGDGRVIGKSYGDTKANCGKVGKTLDAIVDGLEAGEIVSPV